MSDRNQELEAFPNPNPGRDYTILHICPEFTSVCPITGLPDFAIMKLEYVPDELCVELKSLKYYYYSFRQKGIFYEAVTNQILDDLVELCKPRKMTVIGEFAVRGGISSVITVTYEKS